MKKLYYFIALIVILIINIILFFFIENVAYIIATACIIFEIINVQNKLKNNDHDYNNENQD